MYRPEQQSTPLVRRGSLRSLRSAPLLSTVLENTLSLTHLHPIASLELPGLEYATVQSQSALATHQRELGASCRSGIATICGSLAATQSQSTIAGRLHAPAFRRNLPAKRYVHKTTNWPKHKHRALNPNISSNARAVVCLAQR